MRAAYELVKLGQELTADAVLSERSINQGAQQDARRRLKRAEAALVRLTNGCRHDRLDRPGGTVILKGRDLAMARAGRGIEDEIERNLSPAELAIFRRSKIEASYDLSRRPQGGRRGPATPAEPVVVRISWGG